ncbi:MAG: aminotransferase class I/II-fold pyridoxal phosphate-dependent enzyme [Candidatus Latescibacteria bacterium]|jgi:dTDP-4-amino-4,6-dideoxygalactose transaminase|nr:aminotransferase class I/II-fold pyridoxal phosphate-dependent enzyme [Candidatus Latescibacterota bacterium]
MGALAIVGGPRTVPENHAHELAWTQMIEEEAEAVAGMVRQGNLSTPGGNEIIKQFEREISDCWGVRYALCTPNGTAAIHSGLFACGVGPGDEVIVQSYTHPFSVLPILAVGAVPVFADIHPDTLSIDLDDLERKITSGTRAIIPVAGGRRITDIRAIMEIARRHELKVVEDSCTCFCERVEGKHYRTFGQAGNLSLQIRKMLGSGEGGVVFTDDEEVYERATLLGHYERVPDLPGERLRDFGAMALGFKYRMSPVTAAIARIKLGHLERRPPMLRNPPTVPAPYPSPRPSRPVGGSIGTGSRCPVSRMFRMRRWITTSTHS